MNRESHHCKTRKGPSSFWMQDPGIVFDKLNLKPGDAFLDLGCGIGDYSLEASKYVGDEGLVFSVDHNYKSVDVLKEEVSLQKIKNIHAFVEDATDSLSLLDNSIDLCFISTVLHSMDYDAVSARLIPELKRVLKNNGTLSIIECHKERKDFGPPEEYRISPEEVESLVASAGFKKKSLFDLGHNYLIQFGLEEDV